MTFKQLGFEKFNTKKKKKIINLKLKIYKVFSLIKKLNGLNPKSSDKDILELYHKNKKLWIAAYDQIRMLPEIYKVIDDRLIKKICSIINSI